MQDVKKLSPAEQTSAVEAYHNVVCYFAPKALHFFYAKDIFTYSYIQCLFEMYTCYYMPLQLLV